MNKTKIEVFEGAKHISSHGYVKIYIGRKHPLADSKGFAYEHRLIAAQVIGRLLTTEEKVHHRDGNKQNNDPINFDIVYGNAEHYLYHRKRQDRRKPGEANELLQCQCGCGTEILKFDNTGRPRKYVSGHNMMRRENAKN